MRILTCLTASLPGVAMTLAHPAAAFAESDQDWKTCVSTAAAPTEKVTACSAVSDARTETGKKLAAAYCFRGHGLTEKRELDAALSDLNESIRLDPDSACALTDRGRVYAVKRDIDRASVDFTAAINSNPSLATAYGIAVLSTTANATWPAR